MARLAPRGHDQAIFWVDQLSLSSMGTARDIDDLEIYQKALNIGRIVWDEVSGWSTENRSILGNQLVRSTDSIAANISEGFGRFHYKDKKRFCYFARGSLFETRTWVTIAHDRGLLEKDQFDLLVYELRSLQYKLNRYTNKLGQ